MPHALPYDVPDFTGRRELMQRLEHDAASGGIIALDGMPGVGKTTLAIHLGHRVAHRFTDGQLYVDLRAHSSGTTAPRVDQALGMLLRMVGVPDSGQPDSTQARSALWRTRLAGRRMLVVIDNAADVGTVLPLLPGDPGCLVVVTSRTRLIDLDGARFHPLDVLAETDAVDLLGRVLAAGGADPGTTDGAELTAVARWCGGLPLAIRLVAGRLTSRPGRRLGDLLTSLQDDAARRTLLHGPGSRVHATFAGSFELLDGADQRVLLLLAASPMGEFDATATAALAGRSVAIITAALERLVDAHLLESPCPRRYRMHDLLRDFAIAEFDRCGRDGAGGALHRLYDYYLVAATTAADRLNSVVRRFDPVITEPPTDLPQVGDRVAALSWFRTEHDTLRHLAMEAGDWQLACVLRVYYEHQGLFDDWRVALDTAADCAGEDPIAQGLIAMSMGALHGWQGDHDAAITALRRAAALLYHRPDLVAAALTTTAMHLHLMRRDAEAVEQAQRALALPNIGVATEAMGWCNLALATARLGDGERALGRHARAVAEAERSDDLAIRCAAQLGLGETLLRLGRPATAPFELARELAEAQGNRMQQAIALDGLAHATGDAAHWQAALAIFAAIGVPQAGLVERHLDQPGRPHCDLCAGFEPDTPMPVTNSS